MKIDTSALKPVLKKLRKIAAYHMITSFILFMGVLIYCVYSIQAIFNTPHDNEYEMMQMQKNTKTSFDKKTIEQIKTLRTRTESNDITLPQGRVNPFRE